MPRGKKPTAGRYQTRAELEYWVRHWWADTKMNQTDIARACRVSPTTVANILNKKPKEK